MSRKIKVGIVSANWSLKVHGAAWRMLPNVEVAAICTAHRETAEAAAQQFGIAKAYWHHEQMLEDKTLDVIDVGTRPSIRQSIVVDALNSKKHVYSALPFATDLAMAEKLEAVRQRNQVVGVVDAQFRWVPAAMQLKHLLDSGFIGKPLGFNMQLLLPLFHDQGKTYPHCAYPGNGLEPYRWLADKNSGGSGWRNFASHSVLLLSHLLGRVKYAQGLVDIGVPEWQLPDGSTLKVGNEDLGVATLKLENGAIGSLQAGWCVPDAQGVRLEIWGDRGRVLYTDPGFGDGVSARLYSSDARCVQYGTSAGQWHEIDPHLFNVPNTHLSQLNAPPVMVPMAWMFHHMLEAIEGRHVASPSFADAVHAQWVVEQVIDSSKAQSL